MNEISSSNDVYAISGRVKNHIAVEDMALSPAGVVLVNYFSLMLKDLYDFSDKLPLYGDELRKLLATKETLPMLVIKVSAPTEQPKSLYEQIEEAKPLFGSTQEALDHYSQEYDDLGGDDFWLEAESSSVYNESYSRIMRLSRSIQMCRHLLEKERADE